MRMRFASIACGSRWFRITDFRLALLPFANHSMNLTIKAVSLGVLAALSLCAQKIEMESDQSVDFSKFRTFTIRQGRLNSKNPSLNSDLIRKRIDSDIQKYL